MKLSTMRLQTLLANHEGAHQQLDAKLRLAESDARAQAALSAQAVNQAALERIEGEQARSLRKAAVQNLELLQRRGADALRVGSGRAKQRVRG